MSKVKITIETSTKALDKLHDIIMALTDDIDPDVGFDIGDDVDDETVEKGFQPFTMHDHPQKCCGENHPDLEVKCHKMTLTPEQMDNLREKLESLEDNKKKPEGFDEFVKWVDAVKNGIMRRNGS